MEKPKAQEFGVKKEDFNRHHPELQEGEIFLGNFYQGDASFDHIKWKTKRAGSEAYTKDGESLLDYSPVFVQRSEVEKAGIKPATETTIFD